MLSLDITKVTGVVGIPFQIYIILVSKTLYDVLLERQVSFAGHRSQLTAHSSHQNQKAISNTGDVRITRDSQEIYRYFHATNVLL